MKKIINKKRIMLMLILSIILVGISAYSDSKKTYYRDVIKNEYNIYNGDNSKASEAIKKRLKNKKLTSYEKGINKVALATMLFLDGNFDEFESSFKDIESYLIEYQMYEELVHLYSMITNIYTSRYEYEKAYVYIYQSELITSILYKEKKDDETLSTLLAIRYLKSNMAFNIGLDTEADKAFEDAEKLRKENNIRKRVDSYMNITRYYCKKGNLEQTKKYALETIELARNKEEYKSAEYKSKIILTEVYIKMEESTEKINKLLKDIEENYNPRGKLLVDKYLMYAKLYDSQGMQDKSIEYTKKAYELLREGKDFRIKKQVIDKLIYMYEKANDEDELLIWYKEYIDQNKKHANIEDNRFLIGKIIDTDIANANSSIKILELEKNNLMYIEAILLILLIIIILILRKLIYINRHDALTNIYNRGYFNKIYTKYNDNKENYSVIIFDIDNFKKLNDIYGHDFGDIVLIKISALIKNMLGKDSKFFRYGGEEFVILVKSNDIDNVLNIAESIRRKVEYMTWRESTKVTISMGVACSNNNVKNVIKIADDNLYKSKKSGKNKVTYSNV
ncbi:MAG: diguanylate cyclase [Peptostreptococcaceae bacterium]